MTTTTESTLALEWPFHMLLSKHDDSMTPQTLLIQQKNIIHSQTTNPIWTGEVHYINPSVFLFPSEKHSQRQVLRKCLRSYSALFFAEPALQLDPSSDREKLFCLQPR